MRHQISEQRAVLVQRHQTQIGREPHAAAIHGRPFRRERGAGIRTRLQRQHGGQVGVMHAAQAEGHAPL
jgi:aromatic ring-cleaving dioxygenase